MGFFANLINSLKGNTIYVSGLGTATGGRNMQIEKSELCSAILDCNSTHVAKGQILHVIKDKDGRIKDIKRSSEYSRLFQSPNPMMTKQDFMYCMTWQLQLCNLALAWVKWHGAHPIQIWPLIYLDARIVERKSGGYAVQFTDVDGQQYTLALEDLVVLRRKYNGIGYTGQDNNIVRNSLEMVESLDEGMKQAVQISNKIHGLLKQKNSMLASGSIEGVQKSFIERMKEAAKDGGIVTLDAFEDYTPLNVSAWTANAAQQKQIYDRVYSYWRTPIEVVNNTATEQMMQNYYDSIIEPIWEEMAEAFTSALFTSKEQSFGSSIIVTNGAATGASWNTKLMMIANTKDLGLLTPNEYRELLGYPPMEGGDEREVSLNYVKASEQSKYQTGEETPKGDSNDEESDGED